jgi:hypothetical protein
MFRLFIDIPISAINTEHAVEQAQTLVNKMILGDDMQQHFKSVNIEQINYRLGHDEDRQKSNYLIMNENGHCSNKKSKIVLTSEKDPV